MVDHEKALKTLRRIDRHGWWEVPLWVLVCVGALVATFTTSTPGVMRVASAVLAAATLGFWLWWWFIARAALRRRLRDIDEREERLRHFQ